MPARKPRVIVFIVAYQAESTLNAVLERIPESLFSDYDCSILVVDDASADRTVTVGQAYKQAHPEIPLTVLKNEYNQGYGGNQKVGYTYAIAEGADAVALLHGDAQYAPEELPNLLAPVCRGEADAVFGSRMLEPFAALKGGMPLYKYVGNRILSTVQNRLLRSQLSEFHSGYRVYSVPLLKRLHFKLNSNDFHFDSEKHSQSDLRCRQGHCSRAREVIDRTFFQPGFGCQPLLREPPSDDDRYHSHEQDDGAHGAAP
jgi:glycosyltransferase involved in cell wall biosynthesis